MLVFAYLDPGTGSFILQGLIASVLGGVVVAKMYWQRLKDMVFGAASLETTKDAEREASESS